MKTYIGHQLNDWVKFAAAALPQVMRDAGLTTKDIASMAADLADAMMAERAERDGYSKGDDNG